MVWYVIFLDGEIAHLGVEPHATKALAESSAAEVLAQRKAERRAFPYALLEVPEPLAATGETRWYVLELVEMVAFVGPDGPFDTEAEAREAAVRRYALWALLRVCGFLPASPPLLRPRRRSRGSRPRSYHLRARLDGGRRAGARGGPGA